MLATKHNSCLYFPQSLSLSLRLYINCSKKTARNSEIQWANSCRRHIHKLHILVLLYNIVHPKKVSLFDLM